MTVALRRDVTYLVHLFILSANSSVGTGAMKRFDLNCFCPLSLGKRQSHKTYQRLSRPHARDCVVIYVKAQMIGCPAKRANCRLVCRIGISLISTRKASLIGLPIKQVRVTCCDTKKMQSNQKQSGLKLR